MSINNINNISDIGTIGNVQQTVKNAAIQEELEEKAPRQDSFVKSVGQDEDETGIYSRESIIEQLKNSEEQRVKAFEDTIRSMLAQQGETINLTFRGMDLHITEEQSKEAEKAISDGGEYSVENVSDRIMQMAKALAGDDPTKIDLLQNAVVKGFEGAAGLLGKNSLEEMPDITHKTYENVMKQFEEWRNSYNTNEENANVDKNPAAAAQAAQTAVNA
ncbi:MAG: hypothetical protein ACI4JB_04765 [Porcipelethomonas sp.]